MSVLRNCIRNDRHVLLAYHLIIYISKYKSYIMENGSDDSVCQKCENLIADLAEALLNGCPNCKHRRFKFIKKSSQSVNGLKQSLDDLFNLGNGVGVGVGIKIIDRGTFKIDLKTLTENNEYQDPIIVQDTKGVINIILESE